MNEHEPDPDRDAAALAERLRQTVSSFVRAVRAETETGKSAQTETLGLLDRGGPMTVAALAQLRRVKHQTMRVVVAELESAAFVRSERDPDDHRSRLCWISDAGRAELARGRRARASRIADMIRTTLSEQERETLRATIGLLERMSASAHG